jgi:excisionase family DNA binding protein
MNDTTTQLAAQPVVDPWLTLDTAAAEVQVHPATLRREIRANRLRAARVGGRKCSRVRRSWLNDWLERNATPVEVAVGRSTPSN